jgi:hypothetical protein
MAKQTVNLGTGANTGTGTPIRSAFDIVNDNFSELYDYRPINLLSQGAPANSNSSNADGDDDAPFLQAAITAAQDGGLYEVQIPGGRTYQVASTIDITTSPLRIRGIGTGNAEASGTNPRIVWTGAAGGTMFNVEVVDNNLQNVSFENITLGSRGDGVNRPAHFFDFTQSSGAGSPDTGCWFKNVGMYGCSSHAMKFKAGTNFYIDGCRWDNCGEASGGYGIYVDLNGDRIFRCHIIGAATYTAEAGCGGFMWLDTETNAAGNPMAMINIDSLHVEIDGDLLESYAGGASPYDKRGVFRLGINSANNGSVSHHIVGKMLIVEKPGSGVSSFSVFQITATGGTDTANSNFVNINIDTAIGLGEGSTDSDADDIIRPIGGRIPASRRPPHDACGRWGRFQYGTGLATGYGLDLVSSWIHSLNYQVDYLQTGPVTTVASLETSRARKSMRAYVSDATATTFNSVVAGGGSNNVPVHFDGTDWRIG